MNSQHSKKNVTSNLSKYAAHPPTTAGWREVPGGEVDRLSRGSSGIPLVQAFTHKAKAFGMRMLEIYARGTSRCAYDDSEKASRSKENAQLTTFSSGKKYNADLNGTYLQRRQQISTKLHRCKIFEC